MNKFLITALATSVVGSTAFATDSEWLELDREVAALNNAPILQDASGPLLSGWLIGAYSSNDAGNSDPGNPNANTSGAGVLSAAINIRGTLGQGYEYVVGFNFTDAGEVFGTTAPNPNATGPDDATTSSFAGGNAGVTDAYMRLAVGDHVGIKIGAFRNNTLKSALMTRNRTLFINRSYLGSMFSNRGAGLAFDGSFNRVNWELALMNGRDGMGDESAFSGHIDVDVFGSRSGNEGAHGANEGMSLNIGVTFMSDSSKTDIRDTFTLEAPAVGTDRDDTRTMFDISFTNGAWSAFGEMVNFDNDSQSYTGPNGTTSSPYSAGFSYAWGGNYELAMRYDDWDDALNTTRYIVGFNRYIQGHDMKWQLNFEGGESDSAQGSTAENDQSAIRLGFAVGF